VFSCFDDKESILSFYRSLERILEQALYINDTQFTASVGLSYEKDPESLETLIAQADKNMYQIKQAKSQR
jgi:GGDEF domain-containing protein